MWNTVDVDGAEPDNRGGWADQDCGTVATTGLYDERCSWRYQYICEYESLYACPQLLHVATSEWSELELPVSTKNIRCHYLITAPESKSIKLVLNEINLGPYDRLEVFDGTSGTSHQNWMVTWMGNSMEKIEERGESLELISRTNTFLILFDCTENEKTFNVSYKMVDSPCTCPTETFTHPKGNVTSPGYPGHYCNNLDCKWRFETGDIDTVVQFKLVKIALAKGDYLFVENGDGHSNETMLTRIDAPTVTDNGFNFTVMSPAALRFHSDDQWKAGGFNIEYNFIKRDTECHCPMPQPYLNEELGGSMVFLHTGNNCNFIDCVFVLPTPKLTPSGLGELRIRLNGSVSAVKPRGFLAIHNGLPIDPERNYIAKETGRRRFSLVYQPFGEVTSWADGLTVHYHAEVEEGTSTSGHGFNISFQWLLNCSCGDPPEQVTDQVQVFSSPEFPNNYCPNLDCTWRLKAPDGYRVVFEMLFMRIQTNYDFLDVLDGWSEEDQSRQIILKRYSGFLLDTRQLRSNGSDMELYFHTDSDFEYSGFQLSYYMERLPPPEPEMVEEEVDTTVLEIVLIVLCIIILIQTMILILYLIYRRRFFQTTDTKQNKSQRARKGIRDSEKKPLNSETNSNYSHKHR